MLLAGVGSVVAEVVSGRRDSATALRLGLVLAAIGMAVLAAAPTMVVFVGGLAVYGVGLGIVAAPSLVGAVVGFTVVGAAAAVIAPLSFSAAAAIGREGADGGSPA